MPVPVGIVTANVFQGNVFEFSERNLGVTNSIAVVTSSPDPLPFLTWHDSLAQAIRNPAELLRRLELPESLLEQAKDASRQFPVMVPESFLNRMVRGDLLDPLLRQVLPLADEMNDVRGFVDDAVNESGARSAPGLLKKYSGRALMVLTGACAIHCRYCFRRHYPYGSEPKRLEEWESALAILGADPTIHEVLLSGGDPLMVPDRRLAELISRLEAIPHLRRLRIHSRLPIVLPNRITEELVERLLSSRLTPVMVVHANHPSEIAGDCATALRMLVRSGITTFNQAVLLRGVNDSADVLCELSERLINLGVVPYYLHQLDRVRGAAHFEVDTGVGLELIAEMRRRLPGYAVPRYVREEGGADYKRGVESAECGVRNAE